MTSTDNPEPRLPAGLLLCWYGDDFTGAAAVMEVLTFAGLSSVLFLDLPTTEQLERFPDLQCVGVASIARAQSPEWMDDKLPTAFDALSTLGAPLVHYKVCTTLDSSPHTGSIGRAMELGAQVFKPTHIPVLIAAPQMRRYQCFGHLFAAMSESVYRLDRHPVMAQHPTTPMAEADVLLHLAQQTDQIPLHLMNLEALANPDITYSAIVPDNSTSPCAIGFDSMDDASEAAAGRLIWENRSSDRFVVGSQGVEYALINHWQAIGSLEKLPPAKGIGHVGGIAVVSGSVSATTAEQIAWSRDNGFECIAFDATAVLASPEALAAQIDATVTAGLSALSRGVDPLIYTAAGPDDPAVSRLTSAMASSEQSSTKINQKIGTTLGQILHDLVSKANLKRAIISGGDTSGYAIQKLEIFALTALAPTIPGAAIFLAHANGTMDGLQLALKGGQMGSRDYFGWVRDGGGPIQS